MIGFYCCVSVLMFWVINLVIIGWISGISVGLGVDFRENPVSDLGLGAAALLEVPRGVARAGHVGDCTCAPVTRSWFSSLWS